MKTKRILLAFLVLMAIMIVLAAVFTDRLSALLDRPSIYPHMLFVHVVSASLFFANAVVGMLWEHRSLASGNARAILHTYETVAWLDARFSSPLIVVSLTSGITLSMIIGDMWQIGWLSLAFLLFLFSGVVWIVSDIPTQYRVKTLMAEVDPTESSIPVELLRLLRLRLRISIAGVAPLVVVFVLMIYKPDIVPVARWFG